jgi:hypothetical protein
VNGMRWMPTWLLTSVIAGPTSPSSQPSSPVVVEVHRDSFDWTDAGVGAAATLALVVIALGLTLVLRNR